MQEANEKDDMVYYAGPETVKTTILQSTTGKTLEIENRVDPKLWYWDNRCNLKDTREHIITFLITIIILVVLSVIVSWWEIAILFIFVFIGVVCLYFIPTNRKLKKYMNMSPIEDDYEKSYQVLFYNYKDNVKRGIFNPNIYGFMFLDVLEEYTLVDFFEIEKGICFQYINDNGDYREKSYFIDITRNVNVPHTKIIMYEYRWECIVPYKLQEKAPEQPGTDD